MIIVCLEVECIIYEAQSLKQKRPTVKSIIDRIKNSFNVSIAETDFQNVWQRTKLVAVIVTNEYQHGERVLQQDRKSTRLNSSHVSISYAVFCLKKKTNKYRNK